MNDVVSLDAVRRGRRSAPRGIEAHPSSRFAAGASDEEFDDDADQAEVEQISDEERLERVSDTVVRALSRRQLSSDETHALLMAQGAPSWIMRPIAGWSLCKPPRHEMVPARTRNASCEGNRMFEDADSTADYAI